MDQMGEGSSGPSPTLPTGAGGGEATQAFVGREPVTRPRPTDYSAHPSLWPTEVAPPYSPTEVAPPHPPTEVTPRQPATEIVAPYPPTEVTPRRAATEVVRYGPGVPATPPAGQPGLTAERVWRTGRPA